MMDMLGPKYGLNLCYCNWKTNNPQMNALFLWKCIRIYLLLHYLKKDSYAISTTLTYDKIDVAVSISSQNAPQIFPTHMSCRTTLTTDCDQVHWKFKMINLKLSFPLTYRSIDTE